MNLRDWAIVAGLGMIWGSSFLFNAILIEELGPISVSLGRVGIAALGCWVYLILNRIPLPKDWRLYAGLTLLGIINFSVPFALYPLAQSSVNVGVAGIINALTPIMVVIVSNFWPGGEKATFRKSVGVGIAFASVALMALPAVQRGGGSELWAIGLIVFATFCYGIALNYTRHFKSVNPTVLATLALTGASVALFPFALFFEGVPQINRLESWGSLLFIGIVSTTLPFLIMYRILERVGATNFSTTTFVAPISAVILGFVVLGQAILPLHLAGMLGIFIGILIIDGRLMVLLKSWRHAAKPSR